MTFEEILDQALAMLQRRKRVAYRTLQVQFHLDDNALEALKDELLYAQQVARDEDGRVLVWMGSAEPLPFPLPSSAQPVMQEEPLPQTPSPPVLFSAPDAERRQLTVMFCDLVDSTKLSSQLDPEEYRDVVRAYQRVCTDVIQRYDGHIAQLLGDGLLVYFGYPIAHEEDAQRAVYTGLGIVEAIGNLNVHLEQGKGIKLAVRLGIHTGLVVVGEMGGAGRQEQLALGETPNLAARIQSIAAPDTVVISEATYRLVQGYFECQGLGEQALRGVSQSLPVYQVLQASGVQSRLDVASTRGLTPLVGREQEVGLLIERWEQAKTGQGQVILLSGEAGIGKSRLVQVLKDHVTAEPHTRWECRSSPYYQNTALYPIIDLIQRTLRWNQDDTPEQRVAKLEQILSRYRLPLGETVPLFASLLSLEVPDDKYPPLNLSPQRQRQKTLESIVAILLELAEREPVLFILEDLHWTDPTSQEFLGLLVEQVPTAAIYTLVTCRPHFQPAWHHRSYLTEITVNRLSRNQIERMAIHVADGKTLPGDVLEQLVGKTDGVPLFVEEMTKALLESGTLKEVNGQYELVGSLSSLVIPATLQDSLMARLDRLMTAKVVAQLGATIGRQFAYALLQAVAQLDEPTLQRELGRLVEAELVYQRGLPPHATYTFKHALIQDTAYESLLRSTRQAYHRHIAEVLEERFPETAENQPELLAHHYTEAGLNEQAVGYWYQAGEHARTHSSTAEAIANLTKGLESLTTQPETSEQMQRELHIQISLALAYHVAKGQMATEVGRAYRRARELCSQVGDDQQLFRVLMGLMRGGATRQEQEEYLLEIVQCAERTQDPHLLLEAHMVEGTAQLHFGALLSARRHLEQALALYNPVNHHYYAARSSLDPGVNSLSRLSWTLWMLGYPEQALHRSRETLELARQLGHAHSLAMVCNFAALLHQCRREKQAVYEHIQAAVALAAEHDFHQWHITAAILGGWYLVHCGQGETGISQLQQGLTDYATTGTTLYHEWYMVLLAEVYGYNGHPSKGLDTLTEATTLLHHGLKFLCWEAEHHRLKGQLLLQQSPDNAPEAETCFHQAISIAQNQQAKSWELRATTSLAKLWQSQDKRQEAYDLLAPVYNWFTEGFDTADLQDAKALLEELA